MAETKELEGVVASTTEKFGGAVSIGGQWYSYSQESFRSEEWHSPKKGENVRLTLNPWEKDDGTVKYYVKAITLLDDIEFTEEEITGEKITGEKTTGEKTTYVAREPFRTPAQIMRGEALRAAVDVLNVRTAADYDPDALAAAIVAQAAYFMQYIESSGGEG